MYENILHKLIYNENFSDDNTPATTHQHIPNCCCPYILLYAVASNTTSLLLFTSLLFGMWCDFLPPHTTFKNIFVQFGLCENYFTRILFG